MGASAGSEGTERGRCQQLRDEIQTLQLQWGPQTAEGLQPRDGAALRAMGEDPGLKGRIPVPVLTLAGEPACADADRTCLIYQWIEGESYCARQFSAKELRELMRIVAAVHQFSVPKPLCEGLSREAFDIPFAARLEELLQNAPKDLILPDQRQECMALLEHLQKLRGRLQSAALPVVVCHGDIHRGNVMRDSLGLVLIDWEGLYLAPPEADLFFFQRCQGEMNAFYQKLCRYKPNPVALEFFAVRRRLEDIFEFLVSLLIDKVAPREEAYLRRLLQSELKRLHLPMEFDFL